jgi:predicted dinucleotide-binding enzyme
MYTQSSIPHIRARAQVKVGVLGSGIVGQTLAAGFVGKGIEAMVGTRSPEKLVEWRKATGERARVGSFAEAASFGDLVVLAVKGTAALNVLTLAGSDNLSGKTVVDTTNPIADAPPENGVLKFFTSLDESLMERVQAAFPDARFVKAFSSVGSALMVDPDFGGTRPTMFICGNDPDAKAQVTEILDGFGHDTKDMGGVEAARAIEPLCILWCIPGFQRNEWTHAFKLLEQ